MLKATAKRAHEAWIEERWQSGPVWPQQRARHKTERRYLYPAPVPACGGYTSLSLRMVGAMAPLLPPYLCPFLSGILRGVSGVESEIYCITRCIILPEPTRNTPNVGLLGKANSLKTLAGQGIRRF